MTRRRAHAAGRRPIVRGRVAHALLLAVLRGRMAVALLLTILALGACKGKKEFEPPDREARVADAAVRFAEIDFDTIVWESEDARALEGNAVYAAKCRNCHGPLGRGDTEYATNRGLEVPSLVDPGGSIPEELDVVRERVFVGHPSGMPTFGVAGISAREIDAVAFYLLERLRPEVLDGG